MQIVHACQQMASWTGARNSLL